MEIIVGFTFIFIICICIIAIGMGIHSDHFTRYREDVEDQEEDRHGI